MACTGGCKSQGKDYDVKMEKPFLPKNDVSDEAKSDKAPDKDSHVEIKESGLARLAAFPSRSREVDADSSGHVVCIPRQ